MIISLIVAADRNRGIGKDNNLIWHLPNDLKFFKQKTSGHCIIMGRKTFESIGKALPNRTNVVISRQPGYEAPGCLVTGSLQEALAVAAAQQETEVFVIGGGEIFRQSLPMADRVYFTQVHETFDAEVFFPETDYANWDILLEEHHKADDRHLYDYSFYIYERKK